MILDDYLTTILGMVVETGKLLAPDDDWLPTLFLTDGQGQTSLAVLETLIDAATKAATFELIIPDLIRRHQAAQCAFCVMSWTYSLERMATLQDLPPDHAQHIWEAWGPPSADPDRRELLTVVAADWAGQVRAAFATVKRQADHAPTLDPWVTSQPDVVSGRVPEPMLAALRANAQAHRN